MSKFKHSNRCSIVPLVEQHKAISGVYPSEIYYLFQVRECHFAGNKSCKKNIKPWCLLTLAALVIRYLMTSV